MESQFIVKIESFEGDDTYVRCGNGQQDYLYCVINVDANGHAEIVDSSYRSFAEAAKAWPEAASSTGKPKSVWQ